MLGKTYMFDKLVCLVLLDSNSAEVKGCTIHDGGIPYFADVTSDIWKPGVLVSARRGEDGLLCLYRNQCGKQILS